MWGLVREVGAVAFGMLALVMIGSGEAAAAEVTLRMKGGDFAISGELKAFDTEKYTIQSKSFGIMSLDASRFECEGAGCPKGPYPPPLSPANLATGGPASTVLIAGSDTIGHQLMPALVQAYAQAGGVRATRVAGNDPLELQIKLSDAGGRSVGTVQISHHGSDSAFKELEQKRAAIGMSSRPISPEEAQRLAAIGLGDMRSAGHEHVLGLDGLLVLVAADNPAVSISIDDLAKVFAGQITDWSELGLPPGKITVYAPAAASGNAATFDALVMKPRKLELTPNAKRTIDNAELSDWVARDPTGIGVTGLAYLRSAKALNIAASCALISRPSTFSVKTEEYPLTRRLYLYTAGQPREPLARGILAYALSADAQAVIKQSDFVDQGPDLLDFSAQTHRIAYALNAQTEDFDMPLMRALINDMKDAKRLSITFRFSSAGFTLDSRALADIDRLRDVLLTPDFKGRTVLLLGFADSFGSFPSNLALAERRANAVQRALIAAGKGALTASRLVTKAYGELAPVACNDTFDSRQYNRRVEVWIKN